MWRPGDDRRTISPPSSGDSTAGERRLNTAETSIDDSTGPERGSPRRTNLASSFLDRSEVEEDSTLPQRQAVGRATAQGEPEHTTNISTHQQHARSYRHSDQQHDAEHASEVVGRFQDDMQQHFHGPAASPFGGAGAMASLSERAATVGGGLFTNLFTAASFAHKNEGKQQEHRQQLQLQQPQQRQQHRFQPTTLSHDSADVVSKSSPLLPTHTTAAGSFALPTTSSCSDRLSQSPHRSDSAAHPAVTGPFEVPPFSSQQRSQQSRMRGSSAFMGGTASRSPHGGGGSGGHVSGDSSMSGAGGLLPSTLYGGTGGQWDGLPARSREASAAGSVGEQSSRPRLPSVSHLLGSFSLGQQHGYGAGVGQERQTGPPTPVDNVKEEPSRGSHHHHQQQQQQRTRQPSLSSGWAGMGVGSTYTAAPSITRRISTGSLSGATTPPSTSKSQQLYAGGVVRGGSSNAAMRGQYPPTHLHAPGDAMHPPQAGSYSAYPTTPLTSLPAAGMGGAMGGGMGQVAGFIASASPAVSRKRPRSASPGSSDNSFARAASEKSERGGGPNFWPQQQVQPGCRLQPPRYRRLGGCHAEGCEEPAQRAVFGARYCYHHAGLPHAPSLSPQRRSMSPRSPLRLNTTPEDPAPSLKQQENFPASTSKQQQPLLQQHQRSSSSTAAGAVSSGDGGSSFGGFSTGSTGSPASRDSEDVTTAVAGDGLGSLLPTGGLAPESSGSSTGRRGGRVSGTARGGRGSAARRGGGAGARVTGVRDGSRCEVPGCATQPRYAPNGASLPRFCGLHKRPGHMNVVSRCCKHPSCSKVPHFANDRERPLYCGEHKLQGMVNVANRRCEDPACQRQPTYGNKGDKRPRFCSTHKHPGMHDVIARRCEAVGCMTRAAFNFHGEKNVRFCAAHKLGDMENLKSKCCEVEGCKKYRVYGFEGEPAVCCASHKREGMVDVRSSRCEFAKCFRHPSFGYKWEKKRRFCGKHKLADMIDVRSRNHPQKAAAESKTKTASSVPSTAASELPPRHAPPRRRLPAKASASGVSAKAPAEEQLHCGSGSPGSSTGLSTLLGPDSTGRGWQTVGDVPTTSVLSASTAGMGTGTRGRVRGGGEGAGGSDRDMVGAARQGQQGGGFSQQPEGGSAGGEGRESRGEARLQWRLHEEERRSSSGDDDADRTGGTGPER